MRITLFIIGIWTMVAMGRVMAQKPLQRVCADSVVVDDFFWYDLLDTIPKLCPDAKPCFMKEVDACMKNPAKLQKDFAALEPLISLTGCKQGVKDLKQKFVTAREIAEKSMGMALLTRKAKYFDYCERAFYNEIVGAWYDRKTEMNRKDILQMVQDVPAMLYATSGKDLYMNLYMRSSAHIVTDDINVKISTMTSIPWYFRCMFKIEMELPEQEFALHMRVPSWMEGKGLLPAYEASAQVGRYNFYVNADKVERVNEDGYFVIRRKWRNGDVIRFDLPAPIVRLWDKKEPSVIALQRGMLVYAFDNTEGYIKPSEGISNKYDREKDTSFLTPKRYDKQGNPKGEWRSEPYFRNREEAASHLFVKQWEQR